MYETNEIIEKYIILLLGVDERPVPSMLHIQKELFILSKLNPVIQKYLQFEQHYKGPYSQVLEESVKEPLYYENTFVCNKGVYSLTSYGKQKFKEIVEKESRSERFRELVNALKLIRNLYDKLSEEELLFLIYVTYPESTEFSNISERLLNDKEKRKQLADSLLRKRLITKNRYQELIEDEKL